MKRGETWSGFGPVAEILSQLPLWQMEISQKWKLVKNDSLGLGHMILQDII